MQPLHARLLISEEEGRVQCGMGLKRRGALWPERGSTLQHAYATTHDS